MLEQAFGSRGVPTTGLINALFFGGIALTESAMQQVLQITL
jgi:hypothetical protein